MAFWNKLFGGGGDKPAAVEAVEYEGFRITPKPLSSDGGYRIGAVIERDADGETRRHELIRADVIRDLDEANEASIRKAKQMIDQMGTRLFDA